jgi:O-antigen chain-terminating methyltransferase
MPRKNFKDSVVSVPGLGYLVRLASNTVRLPKLHDQLVQRQEQTNRLLAELAETAKKLTAETAKLSKEAEDARLAQDDLQGQFSLFETSHGTKAKTESSKNLTDKELFADDHLMDNFYTGFEDRFRGSEAMISKRLEEYLPYFSNSKVNFGKAPVLDIGSGRGEMLQLLKKHDIAAIGLDINHDMVERSKKKSLKAVQGDALSYLQAADSQSYGAITGFHLVEHIPFNVLLRIFKGAYRALAKDGFVIFETPNPENLIVGSTTFYTDPSHLHPLPPVLLAFALETCGFKNIEIKRLHPDTDQKTDGLDPEVAKLLFGPRDYAVIAYK